MDAKEVLMDWKLFATKEEIEEAKRAVDSLRGALAQADREISTLHMFAMTTNERMVAAEIKRQQAEKSNVDAIAALHETCQKALEKHGPRDVKVLSHSADEEIHRQG